MDFCFCLRWHAHATQNNTLHTILKQGNEQVRLPRDANKETIAAYVYFMLLENLEYLSKDGGMTVLGNVLKDTKAAYFTILIKSVFFLETLCMIGSVNIVPQSILTT